MTFSDVWNELKEGFFPKKKGQTHEKGQEMLDKLNSLFVQEGGLFLTVKTVAAVLNLLSEFNEKTLKDVKTKNDVIDCVIYLLQQEKR